jgi:hypothetical protein
MLPNKDSFFLSRFSRKKPGLRSGFDIRIQIEQRVRIWIHDYVSTKPVLWIRIGFNGDPDPAI